MNDIEKTLLLKLANQWLSIPFPSPDDEASGLASVNAEIQAFHDCGADLKDLVRELSGDRTMIQEILKAKL